MFKPGTTFSFWFMVVSSSIMQPVATFRHMNMETFSTTEVSHVLWGKMTQNFWEINNAICLWHHNHYWLVHEFFYFVSARLRVIWWTAPSGKEGRKNWCLWTWHTCRITVNDYIFSFWIALDGYKSLFTTGDSFTARLIKRANFVPYFVKIVKRRFF